MFINYSFKSYFWQTLVLTEKEKEQKSKSSGFGFSVLMLLFAVISIQAQTTRIGNSIGGSSVADGTFSSGSTFVANGWNEANEGSGVIKWAVGTAISDTSSTTTATATTLAALSYSVTLSAANFNIAIGQLVTGANIPANTYVSNINGTALVLTQATTNAAAASNVVLTFGALASNITGNAAYPSYDNGTSYSTTGFGARTVYFYKDIPTTAGETNMILTFDWLSGSNTWQVYAVPTSNTPVGSDVSTTLTAALAGATPIVFSNTNNTTQTATGFIPPSFATGTPFRLIFVWSNAAGGGSTTPIAIDNISLVSRAGGQTLTSFKTGLFTDASTWSEGYVPSPADDVVVNTNHVITINDKANLGAENVFYGGNGAVIQFGFFSDQFTINNDLLISGSGSRFNVYEPTGVTGTPAGTGKLLKVGHDISFTGGGRLDVAFGNTSAGFGELVLNGTTLQTISTDGISFLGNTTKANGTTNTFDIINQLTVTNTSSATPNINWQLNNVRIKGALRLTSGRVNLNSNKIILGNFAALTATSNLGTGFIGGTVAKWYATGANGGVIDAGIDYNVAGTLFPVLSATGQNRWSYVISPASATKAGELALTYTDAAGMTSVSIADGITVDSRFNGSWSIATPDSRVDTTVGLAADFIYTHAAGTAFRLGIYGTGAFAPNDGNSRIVYAAGALAGTHINGTTSPFVAREGLTLANITSGPLYLGAATSSIQGAVTRTSATTGDWNTPTTWSPSGVPACGDVVTIAAAHTVTVSATPASGIAGLTINAGGTLVNAGGTLTVGCTNNNAIFTNFGTNTVSGGTLLVNGAVYHKLGSTFNHTSGDVIIDSNNNGDAATSVGQGGSSMKLDTSNLNLTGGTITIVDPLVNNTITTTASSATNYTMATIVSTFAKPTNDITLIGSTVINMTNFNRANTFSVGQVVTGTGIAAGTTITAVTVPLLSNQPVVITISQATTAEIPSATNLNFSAMSNGANGINFPTTTANWGNIAIGQIVTGNGIPAGTTVTSFGSGFADSAYTVFLSNPVSGLATSPIIAAETITFSAASPNCSAIILTAANPLISVGQAVSGTGIATGTTVSTITTVNGFSRLDLSLPTTGAMIAPVALSFYAGNLNSYAFAYNSPVNYDSGFNHTIQIGNGISIEKAPVTTNGFLCNFIQGGGRFSIGNLTINAPDGDNRFFNVTNILNVQNALTITSGSVFKKTNTTGGMFFGGNITNNGSFFMTANTLTSLANAAIGATTLPQTISGSGNFYNQLTVSASNASLAGLTVNNTSTGGVTISYPNFRLSGSITFTAGIIHTSTAFPLYHGAANLSSNPIVSGTPSNTAHIDGPYARSFSPTSLSTNFGNFPVGKNGVYMPIALAVANGGYFIAEAFTTNTGSTTVNASNISTQRWKAERVGVEGTFTNFNVSLGSSSIAANNIVVQASTDQGTDYDNAFGYTMTYTAGTSGAPNTIATTTALAGASFTGNFAYATLPVCSTVNPGNTIADLTKTTVITVQNSNNTNGIVGGSVTVNLNAANTFIAVGQTVTGTGIAPGTTVTAVDMVSTIKNITLSQPAASSAPGQTTLTFSTVTTPTTLCGSQQVALSIEFPGTTAGLTYQWQSSPDATLANYTNISGAISSTYNVTPTANMYYRCVVTCVNGPISNASTGVLVSYTAPSVAIASTTDGVSCEPSTPVTVSATVSSGTLAWYATANGGSPLGTGLTYTSSPATTTTYYAVAESTSTYTVGRTLTGTSTNTANFTGLMFNTNANVRLNSVKLHPRQIAGAPGAGAPITIKLFKDGVQVPGTQAVTFTPTTNIAAATSISIFNVVDLNYDIPAGNGYKLFITSGLSANNLVARVATGSVILPQGNGSVTIIGGPSNFETVGSSDNQNYNNFFEMSFSDVCATPRVPVIANVNPLDFANLQFPATATICQGSTFTAYGQVYEAGITEAPGQGNGIDVEFGVSPISSNTNPSTWTSWSPASFNVQVDNNDEYQFTTGSLLTAGTYYYTFRYKKSACTTWQYGGTNNGFWNGTTNNSGMLTITPATTNGSVTTSICAGESYVWPLPEGTGLTYTTTQTNLTNVVGCNTATLNLTVTPATTNGSVTTSICAGDSYTWPLPEGTGLTYTTAQTGLTNVVGCNTATLNLTLNTTPEPTGNATQTISVVNPNDATIANLVVSPTTGILWYGSLANAQSGTNPLPTTTVLTTGATYWAVNVVGGCPSVPFAVTVTVALGVDGFDNANFRFYPNPTSSIVNFAYSSAITKITVMNLLGQVLQENKSNDLQVTVDLSSYPSSTYLIRVEADTTSKIVKVVKR
jgi:hypothetical protein